MTSRAELFDTGDVTAGAASASPGGPPATVQREEMGPLKVVAVTRRRSGRVALTAAAGGSTARIVGPPGAARTVTVPAAVAFLEAPLASVTVTVYLPAGRPRSVCGPTPE